MERAFLTHSIALAFAIVVVGSSAAVAGTKFQTSLVPNVSGATPGFSASGSSLFIDGHRALKGKIKKVVDGSNALVTTDGTSGTGDDYKLEIDVTVSATLTTGTITVPFELKNGNGKFSANLTNDAAFAGASLGDGVAVDTIRVKDDLGVVIGIGGFAIE